MAHQTFPMSLWLSASPLSPSPLAYISTQTLRWRIRGSHALGYLPMQHDSHILVEKPKLKASPPQILRLKVNCLLVLRCVPSGRRRATGCPPRPWSRPGTTGRPAVPRCGAGRRRPVRAAWAATPPGVAGTTAAAVSGAGANNAVEPGAPEGASMWLAAANPTRHKNLRDLASGEVRSLLVGGQGSKSQRVPSPGQAPERHPFFSELVTVKLKGASRGLTKGGQWSLGGADRIERTPPPSRGSRPPPPPPSLPACAHARPWYPPMQDIDPVDLQRTVRHCVVEVIQEVTASSSSSTAALDPEAGVDSVSEPCFSLGLVGSWVELF